MKLTYHNPFAITRHMKLMRYAAKTTETDLLACAINEKVPHAIDKYVLVSASDMHGAIIGVSQGFCTLSGFQSTELTERSYEALRHPQMSAATFNDLWCTIKAGKTWVGEILNRTKKDDFFWVMADISPVMDHHKVVIGYIAVYQDITGLKALETLSITDPMTHAYNRRYFEKVMSAELARAKREQVFLCFLMADADHFKQYNDTYGHLAGDGVIKAIVDTLHEVFRRPGDLVFRLGGEEFAALYPVAHHDDASSLAEKVRQGVYDRHIEHTGNHPSNRVTISIGLIMIAPDEDSDVDEIYKYSDIALYQAKDNGRNRVEIHSAADPEIDLF